MSSVRNAIAAAILAATASFPSARSASAQALDRSKRPVAPPAVPFKFPRVVTKTLSNGLTLAVVENHSLPVVAVRIVLAVDSLADPPGKEGLFSLTQQLLRDGTANRTAEQFANEFVELGDNVTASGFTLLSSEFERALGLTADMLQHPTFPDSALDRRKSARIAGIKALLQSPYTAPRLVFYKKVWGDEHPMARSVVPTEAALQSITRGDVEHFYEQYFHPENAIVVVSGDVSAARAASVVSRLFKDWKRGKPMTPARLVPLPTAATTIYLIDRPGATQSYVYVGQLGPPRKSRNFYALETLAPILGSIPGSRLQNILREQHSYVYSSTPFTITWRRAPTLSMMFGQAAINPVKTDSALLDWTNALRVMREDEPVTETELSFGKAARIASMPARIETTDSVATRVVELVRDALPFDFYDRYVSAIGALTAADVTRAAFVAFRPTNWTIVVAGDRKVIEAGLRSSGIGPVIVVDEDGKQIP